VTWNVERGQELTVADLARATTLWAALAERVSAFFAGFPAVISCYRMASPRQEGSMEKLRDNAVRAAGLGR